MITITLNDLRPEPLRPDEVVAARTLSPGTVRELRRNGPAWAKPYRIQTLDKISRTSRDVEALSAAEAAAALDAEHLDLWISEDRFAAAFPRQ